MEQMKEYLLEAGEEVDLEKLKSGFAPKEEFVAAHRNLPIVCHDVFIEYQGGILTVVRDNEPMKGERWILGGRIQRGMPIEESLRDKVRKECGLDLHDIKYLGAARVFQRADPFGHGRGADNPVFVYFARGEGEIKLDPLHKDPKIITKDDYKKIRTSLHPYIQDFMDKAMKLL